ncbi:DeoR family transcriptional regulator, partial [Enterococcus faecalis]|nr:DeoR family transcriptional regulator [Enterococcus faecalis]
MIEKYIEKDIIRQVKLTEYLLDMKTLNINDVATTLHVNSNTIKRDFQKICTFLEDHILNSSFTSKE